MSRSNCVLAAIATLGLFAADSYTQPQASRGSAPSRASAANPRMHAFAVPHGRDRSVDSAGAMVLGADGAMWALATESVRRGNVVHVGVVAKVLRVTPKGAIAQHRVPITFNLPSRIVASESAVWVAGIGASGRRSDRSYIVRVSLRGKVTTFKVPSSNSFSQVVIAKALGHAVWYFHNSELRELNDAGRDRLLAKNAAFKDLRIAATGTDGTLWVQGHGFIARMNADYTLTRFSTRTLCLPRRLSAACFPTALLVESSGVTWVFGLSPLGRVGTLSHLDAGGRLSRFRYTWPFPRRLDALARGPDGRLWIAGDLRNVGRLSPGGQATIRLPRSVWAHDLGGNSALAVGRGRTVWLLSGAHLVRFDVP